MSGEDDYNLQEAWDRVCGSFAKTTDLDLKTPPKYTTDQVLEQIRGTRGKEADTKFQQAKHATAKIVNCLYILTGIVAQGASMVFGPSNLCFNAVTYVVNVGASYKHIFDTIAELFGRISDVLDRCKIYLGMPTDSIDISLRRIINDELLSFVRICALSTKVFKGSKINIALRVFFFSSDEGVSSELNNLAALVEQETQMRATLGFQSSKKNEKLGMDNKEATIKVGATVDKVLELENQRDVDKKAKEILKRIDENLGYPSKILEVVQTTYKGIQSKKVDSTGDWIKQDPLYTAWANREGPSFSLLCISGGEGSGKSYIYPTVIQDLQDRNSQTPDSDMTCTSLAYYFQGSQPGEKNTVSLVNALKVLAWQVSRQDVVYRKDLQGSSTKLSSVNRVQSLFDLLFSKSFKTDSIMFLLFDGMDQWEKEQIKDLCSLLEQLQETSNDWPKFRLRILISCRDAVVGTIESHVGRKASVLQIASKNRTDIELFIRSRMDKMDTLTGTSSQVEELRAEILKKLVEEANGDFISVGLLLNEIAEKQRPGEIKDVLSKSGEARSDTIARKIEGLNETLGDSDIADLNELLLWVLSAFRPLTLEELESALLMKNQERSLRPLSDEIQDRYSALFRVTGELDPDTRKMEKTATVSLMSDSIEEYLKTKAIMEAAEDSKAWNSTGDVNESEVRIIRQLLRSVCDPNLFKKFDFEGFFDRKLNKRNAKVGVDLENGTAHLKIAIACIQAICSKESLDSLTVYAMEYFSAHLAKVDPSLAQPQIKMSLGPQLVQLFTDERTIGKWWTDISIWSQDAWLYCDDSADIILKWLQDSAVTKNLSEDNKKWVKSLSSKSEPDADLLENIAKFLARELLQGATWHLQQVFSCLCSFVTKIAHRKDPDILRSTSYVRGDNQVTVVQIRAVVDWAKQELELDSFGYEENRNIARIYREFGNPEEAIEHFKLASSLRSKNYLSQRGLAQVYENQEEWALSIEILQTTRVIIENLETPTTDDQEDLDEVLLQLARCHNGAGNIDQALELYEGIVKKNPQDYDSVFEVISLFRKKGDFAKLLEFLEDLKQSKDEATGLDRRTQLFHSFSWRNDYHETILAVGSNSKTFDVLRDAYEKALEVGEVKLKVAQDFVHQREVSAQQGTVAMLLHYFALFLYNHNVAADEKEYAISLWERILVMDIFETYSLTWCSKQLVLAELSSVYFREACLAVENCDAAATYIGKLEEISIMDLDEDGESELQTYPKQLLARWYTMKGEESKAKNFLRPLLKTTLDLLSDEDPTNDWQGLTGIAAHSMYANQDDDALAAMSLIIPTEPDDQDSTLASNLQDPDSVETAQGSGDKQAAAQENLADKVAVGSKDSAANGQAPSQIKSQPLQGPLEGKCDGGCGKEWSYSDDIYICRECSNIWFDELCLQKLRMGTMNKPVCKENHEMLHVPKYDETETKKIGKGNVKVGTRIMTVDDWVLDIKDRWGIVI